MLTLKKKTAMFILVSNRVQVDICINVMDKAKIAQKERANVYLYLKGTTF